VQTPIHRHTKLEVSLELASFFIRNCAFFVEFATLSVTLIVLSACKLIRNIIGLPCARFYMT